ncbi:MAG: 4-hydroxy-tetrahydrodipicolinate synthase [Minwuia sp.]|uniref:4-hydroxy-tetrahydrodipicolinate synthase n=1 Tax=Minwuia sp. TaxID=2493630 RepID=UPI003A8731DB
MDIKGSNPALITPFQNGSVDEDGFKKFVEWQITEGSHGLVPCGTTGESPTMSSCRAPARRRPVHRGVGRVPVIAGTGSNNTAEALDLTQHAKDAGADACLIVTPYYNKPNQEGLYRHFEALNEVGLPIFIYNIPPRSVIDMTPETMGRLSKLKNVVGVKDATAKLERVSMQRMTCGKDFIQLSGEDGTALAHMAHGGRGCISVTANVAPKLCSEFQEACLAGDFGKALEIQDRLMPLHVALFVEPSPGPVKYAASKVLGLNPDTRLPLAPVTDETRAQVDDALRHAGLLN